MRDTQKTKEYENPNKKRKRKHLCPNKPNKQTNRAKEGAVGKKAHPGLHSIVYGIQNKQKFIKTIANNQNK